MTGSWPRATADSNGLEASLVARSGRSRERWLAGESTARWLTHARQAMTLPEDVSVQAE